jgi:DNA-binding transcriptional regulator YiaG
MNRGEVNKWVEVKSALGHLSSQEAAAFDAHRKYQETQRQLGAELRRLRKKRGLSLRAVAAKLKVSAPFLSDCELGRRYWSSERAEAYLRALGEPASK